ncbi:hypothetical protein A3F65_02720 [Candidatus Saccharibacteria bacterium RIFCSPHIGHO2_12_FULL_47_16b]|nr:MAG: hypothetical protein A3F65_02720 [Candidatus Saccharibacteria bacterium RIFCSPHIGHO2_12_FULL_47_16b]OGL38689.1 MAG: hypothetical protein A3J32_00740 [Candidatus Saccharibacteria bacterium RIFCSPLOWO2_02_FULL_46_7]
MESLQEILSRKKFTPPKESQSVKDYIQRRYQSSCSVTVRKNDVTVSVSNSALAGSLQLEKQKIIKACGIKGKLIIRTGR